MLLAILAFYWGYKKAKRTGRNAALWSVICGFTFIGIQLGVSLTIGIVIGVGSQVWGWDESIADRYSLLWMLVSFVPSFIALWLLFNYLDRIPDEPIQSAPPPPPTFET